MTDPQYRLDVTTGDGKYTVRQPIEGPAVALRYGEPWPAYEGKALPNLVLALAYDLAEAREFCRQLERSDERIASIKGDQKRSAPRPIRSMTRDLATIEAHIDRAKSVARDLYETKDIDLHMCDGSIRTGQHGVLDNIRNDLLALASGLEEAHAKLIYLDANEVLPIEAAPKDDEPLPGFLSDVIAERIRQITGEGWTPEHDDKHDCGELARAGACYALEAAGEHFFGERLWPWEMSWWKPSIAERRNLVKAAALLIAEGERLDRRDGRTPTPEPGAPQAAAAPCPITVAELLARGMDERMEEIVSLLAGEILRDPVTKNLSPDELAAFGFGPSCPCGERGLRPGEVLSEYGESCAECRAAEEARPRFRPVGGHPAPGTLVGGKANRS